jgi:ElaB/YqjD/DUF883 family membrane-anchored ribosome-binding protein
MKTTGHRASHATHGGSRSRGFAAGNRVASEAHKAVDRIAGAADEAALRTRSGIDVLAGRAHTAVDRAAGAAAPAAKWLNAQARSIKANQERLIDDARRTISEHPFAAVGIAAAAGYLLSRILRR